MKFRLKLIIICLVLLTSLVGCSTSVKVDNKEVIRVGMDLKFPPFSYIGDDGNPQGLEPIIAKAFGEYLGKEVEIVDTDFSLLIPALETGDVDILIADMSKTEERALKADFSKPYRYTQSLALVNKEYYEKMKINDQMSPEQFFHLKDSKFIGLAGTFGVIVPVSYGASVIEITEIGSGIQEVINGTATALVASNEVVGFQVNNPKTTIVHPIGNVTDSSFVVALGNEELLNAANEFIDTMYQEGGFYDSIKQEWDPIIAEFMQNEAYGLDYIINAPN